MVRIEESPSGAQEGGISSQKFMTNQFRSSMWSPSNAVPYLKKTSNIIPCNVCRTSMWSQRRIQNCLHAICAISPCTVFLVSIVLYVVFWGVLVGGTCTTFSGAQENHIWCQGFVLASEKWKVYVLTPTLSSGPGYVFNVSQNIDISLSSNCMTSISEHSAAKNNKLRLGITFTM